VYSAQLLKKRLTKRSSSLNIEDKVGEEVFKSELRLSYRKVPPPGSKVKDAAFFRSFSLRDNDARSGLCTETATLVATDNNEPRPAGRPPVDVQGLYQQAYSLRERLLCANLVSAGLGRRYTEDMKFNEYGQVYF
jgi:hypothetical protein